LRASTMLSLRRVLLNRSRNTCATSAGLGAAAAGAEVGCAGAADSAARFSRANLAACATVSRLSSTGGLHLFGFRPDALGGHMRGVARLHAYTLGFRLLGLVCDELKQPVLCGTPRHDLKTNTVTWLE
jgi:hypothetical protein